MTRFALWIVCLIWILSQPALGVVPKEAGRKLQEAQRLYRQDRFADAASALETLVKAQPSFAEAHRLLGHTYLRMQEPEQARRALVKALGQGQFASDVVGTLVRIDREAGRQLALLGELPMMLTIDPDEARWARLWAQTLVRADRTSAAVSILEQIVEEHPASVQAWVALGNAQLRIADPATAAATYETAYHLGAKRAKLASTIARLYREADHFATSLSWYGRGLSLTKGPGREPLLIEQARTRLSLGLAWADRGEIKAIAKSQKPILAQRAADLLAQAAIERHDRANAVKWWTRAVEGGLQRRDVLIYLGGYHFNREEYSQAIEFLAPCVGASTDVKRLRRSLIISLIETGHRQRARTQLRNYVARQGLNQTTNRLIRRLSASSENPPASTNRREGDPG